MKYDAMGKLARSFSNESLGWLISRTSFGKTAMVLAELESGATTPEVAEAIDRSYQAAWYNLRALEREGLVARDGEYWYLEEDA